MDPIRIAQELIRCPSVTPKDEGVMAVLIAYLTSIGFSCQRMKFSDAPGEPTENLYARLGTESPNLCFAGHVDVVPVGDAAAWSVDPFGGVIKDGYLYGRGAEDMKGAIASFVAAAGEFAKTPFKGSLSLLITGDEEGVAVNGTRKLLPMVKMRGEQIDGCIVGEPTNPKILGEMAKIGRRGSAYGVLTVKGKQGHAAYPDMADNPIMRMLAVLQKLKFTMIDEGSQFFPPSNLEITSIDADNMAGNVIPAQVTARFNIRFNDRHTGESLRAWVQKQLDSITGEYDFQWRVSGEAFLTPPGKLSDILKIAVKEVTGLTPELSTSGGTSDARFIKEYCPVVEFGTTGSLAHAVNERVKIDDLVKLKAIYLRVMQQFF